MVLQDYLKNGEEVTTLPIHQMAEIIRQNWNKTAKNGVYFGAVPYLQAMRQMETVDTNYGMDSGKSIIRYFLGNASTWRGPIAKEIKAELNRRLK